MSETKYANRKRRAQEREEQYMNEPLAEYMRPVARKTQMERDRLWQLWNTYWTDINPCAEPDSIWINFCSANPDAIARCRSFLADYIEFSSTEEPILDDEIETESKPTVKAVKTVCMIWRFLVLEADRRVIKKFRNQDRNDPRWHTLIQATSPGRQSKGPVADIDFWITHELSQEYDLTHEQQFVKREATEDDIMLILATLWTRAEDIPCDAQTRLAFHAAVVLDSNGFRPGSVMPLKYKNVRLGFIRDTKDPTQCQLVAEVTIRHNKQRIGKVYNDQKHIVTLLLSSIPCQPLCLVTLLAVQALHDDAFNVPFSSFDELLARPTMENGQTLWLQWKPEVLQGKGRHIINIQYHQYSHIWNRTWFVAGNRTKLRPYALRVGAGAKFDSALSNAARNFILGHNTTTFEMSYQTQRRYDDVQSLTFPKAAQPNPSLFGALRNSSLDRDPGAPLYPTEAELKAFELRKDLQELRKKYAKVREQHKADSPEANQARGYIWHLIEKLSDAAVARARKAYFETLDQLRAEGTDTTGRLPIAPPNPRTSRYAGTYPAAREIGRLLEREDARAGQQRSKFAAMVLAFLGGRSGAVPHTADSQPVPHTADSQPKTLELPTDKSMCLFCSVPFAHRHGLTRHNRNVHINKGTFNQPFSCPECLRSHGKDCVIMGAEEWSNHTEKIHGRQYAPNILHQTSQAQCKDQEERPRVRDARCYVCGGLYFPGRSFSRHFRKEHVRAGRFNEPLPCWSCGDQHRIEGLSMWQTHVKVVHRCDPDTGAKLSGGDVPQKRGLDADCSTAPKRQRVHDTAKDLPIDPRLFNQ